MRWYVFVLLLCAWIRLVIVPSLFNVVCRVLLGLLFANFRSPVVTSGRSSRFDTGERITHFCAVAWGLQACSVSELQCHVVTLL
jgi:hypothetical protein